MFCLSVGEKSWSNVLEVVKTNLHLTHLFEIRLDYLEDELSTGSISSFFEEIQRMFKAEKSNPSETTLQFIFTCRLPEEGGKRTIPEEERLRILSHCLKMGAYLVDLEWKALKGFLKRNGKPPIPLERTLVSFHDFEGTPPDRALKGLMKSMSRASVKLAKVVCFSDKPEDGLRVLNLILYGERLGMKVVAFGMGERLSWTRIVNLILGSPFTYVSPSKEGRTAPGQLDVLSAKRLYEGLAQCIRSTG